MRALVEFAALIYGGIYGSFLNVVVYRLPLGQSLVRPRSRCPHCGTGIAWYDNVPALSWLVLRGRCRSCAAPISARYPLVEAATALLAAGLAWRWNGAGVWTIAAALASGVLLAVALIDWDTFMIPDELSLGLAAAGVSVSAWNPYFAGGDWRMAAWWSLRGGLLGLTLGWCLAAGGAAVFKKEALGGGDVKLLAGVGAWAGATGAFDCLMIGSLFGSLYAVRLLSAGRAKRSDPIPFGPFLAIGAVFNFFRLLPLGWPLV
jgi:leader peptidase (prepilin peptidase)/N-methyltransferase